MNATSGGARKPPGLKWMILQCPLSFFGGGRAQIGKLEGKIQHIALLNDDDIKSQSSSKESEHFMLS